MDIEELKALYAKKKALIKRRLSEFKSNYKKGDRAIFKELCFCILTANASAESGLKAIAALGDAIFFGTEKQISNKLKKCGYRFWRSRARYIVAARKYFQRALGMKIKQKIEEMKQDPTALREFFTQKDIKGIGMKEASHFLRNIGFSDYAILDKHIVRCLFDFRILDATNPPKNRTQYIEMEKRMKEFSRQIGIPLDELDLLLWSSRTGKVLK